MSAIVTRTAKVQNITTLMQLRELVEATADFPPSARVSVDKYNGDVREPGYTSITVQENQR